VRLRNTHPAFDGEMSVETDGECAIRLAWRNADAAVALEVDLDVGHADVIDDGHRTRIAEWRATSME
jgi:hypothetical protein